MNAIKWTARAVKQLRKLDRQRQQVIVHGVAALAYMPCCSNIKALSGYVYGYRLRIGDYRILFDWMGEVKIVEIQEVRKRDERTY